MCCRKCNANTGRHPGVCSSTARPGGLWRRTGHRPGQLAPAAEASQGLAPRLSGLSAGWADCSVSAERRSCASGAPTALLTPLAVRLAVLTQSAVSAPGETSRAEPASSAPISVRVTLPAADGAPGEGHGSGADDARCWCVGGLVICLCCLVPSGDLPLLSGAVW